MERFSIIALMLLLVVAFSLPASASAATSPGVKPGSFFYFFDTTFEKIGLFFTFSPENKARKALEYADERLAEAEAVTENAEAVKTAITNYESNIAFAEEKSKDVGDKEKAEALLTSIADNTSKHQEVLTAVLVKVPDEAKEAITRAIEASRKGHEEAMQKIAELKGEVEKLKQEVAELKTKDEEREKVIEELGKQKTGSATQQKISIPQIQSTPAQKPEQPQTSPKTSIVTLPNGAVVEMDTNGKILRYIKEAPINTTTQTPTIPVAPPPAVPQTQTETLEITSVTVTSDMTSAKIEWQTNKPTESKVFISGGNLSSKIFTSTSGLSTKHFTTLTNLSAATTYSYEIEAITGGTVAVKKSGILQTAAPPPPLPELSYTPVVQVGGLTSKFLYPQFRAEAGCTSAYTDIGFVYFSVLESFDSGHVTIKGADGAVTDNQVPLIPNGILKLGFNPDSTRAYEFSVAKEGFRSTRKSGTFTMPPPTLFRIKRLNIDNHHGGFLVCNWFIPNVEEVMVNFKIKVTLDQAQPPSKLTLYASTKQEQNVANGDILEISALPALTPLYWDFFGNPESLSLDIIEGSATRNGTNVPLASINEKLAKDLK